MSALARIFARTHHTAPSPTRPESCPGSTASMEHLHPAHSLFRPFKLRVLVSASTASPPSDVLLFFLWWAFLHAFMRSSTQVTPLIFHHSTTPDSPPHRTPNHRHRLVQFISCIHPRLQAVDTSHPLSLPRALVTGSLVHRTHLKCSSSSFPLTVSSSGSCRLMRLRETRSVVTAAFSESESSHSPHQLLVCAH
jgi:hypothetical protein